MNINKNAKTILEPDYSYVFNQCLKVGTHIFSLSSYAENYKIYECVITDKMKVDEYGYLSVVLQGVNHPNLKILERIELLACSIHTHTNDFLTREEAEMARIKKLRGEE